MWQVRLYISENVPTVTENKWRPMHSLLKCPSFVVPCFFSGFCILKSCITERTPLVNSPLYLDKSLENVANR